MIAIVGAGKMGEALLAGLLATGYERSEVLISESVRERADELRERYGVDDVPATEAARRAETLILAIKPQDMVEVVDEVAATLTARHLVISVAAGITTSVLEKHLAGEVAVVRAMPNTPALVGKGMTAVSGGTHATDEQLDRAEGMLRSVGEVVRVPERHMDTVTAISGSGPAYFYFLTETLIESAVAMGMTRATAQALARRTIAGAAAMLEESGEHPVVLRENVTSPGGTTAAALRELERHGVRTAVTEAVDAARSRSRDLSEG
ncbi:pyrroline-5-carboxylate reductase [Halostreptopolyspora alba]|uniref:Pyrroline-5-carboxylate reductase n=1 Tax=Halostreptopolyspora alba TaxID=2487137 RepID=A0A3N0E2K4_9ACTN|nr:pyrroline-5-carboxylate reductase [Nocardiopsaceae bacterium YIM 96095]